MSAGQGREMATDNVPLTRVFTQNQGSAAMQHLEVDPIGCHHGRNYLAVDMLQEVVLAAKVVVESPARKCSQHWRWPRAFSVVLQARRALRRPAPALSRRCERIHLTRPVRLGQLSGQPCSPA